MSRLMSIILLFFLSSCTTFSGTARSHPPEVYSTRGVHDIHRRLVAGVLKIRTRGGHGSGFSIRYADGHSFVLTCDHVVETDPAPVVAAYSSAGVDVAIGRVIARNPDLDLALIIVRRKYPVFQFMTPVEFRRVRDPDVRPGLERPGDMVMSAGFPLSIEPAMPTIGFIIDKRHYARRGGIPGGVFTSAGGWFGCSGGPVIHVRSGLVISVVARMYDQDSCQIEGVGPGDVLRFLLEAGRR